MVLDVFHNFLVTFSFRSAGYVYIYICIHTYIYIYAYIYNYRYVYLCIYIYDRYIYIFTHGYISMGASENEESPQMAGEIGKLGVACHYGTFDHWHIRVA